MAGLFGFNVEGIRGTLLSCIKSSDIKSGFITRVVGIKCSCMGRCCKQEVVGAMGKAKGIYFGGFLVRPFGHLCFGTTPVVGPIKV